MKICIGILAHNEGTRIGKTLESLWSQSLFDPEECPDWHIEVVCVPNGCTDDSEEVVCRHFQAAAKRWNDPRLNFRVHAVPEPGKVNAWSTFIHGASDPNADYIILMDADIIFGSDEVLASLVRALEADEDTYASVDQPIKDLERDRARGLLAMLSRGNSRLTLMRPGQLCGQLYCVRGPVIRQIVLPRGLLVEDGVIGALLLTDFFTCRENYGRIRCIEGACHYYDAYKRLSGLFRHAKRQAASHAMAMVLFEYLWSNCTPDCNAGTLLRKNHASDPHWFERLVRNAALGGKLRACRWSIVTSRVSQALGLPWRDSIRYLPSAFAASLWTFIVTWSADRDLRNGQTVPW